MKVSGLLAFIAFVFLPLSGICQDKSFPYHVDLSLQKSLALSIDKEPLGDVKKIDKLLDTAFKKRLLNEAPGKKLTAAYHFYVLKTLAYSRTLDLVVFAYQPRVKGKKYYYFVNVYDKTNNLISSKEIARYISTGAEEISETAVLESNGRINLFDERAQKSLGSVRITTTGLIVPELKTQSPAAAVAQGKKLPVTGAKADQTITVIKGTRKIIRYSVYPSNLPAAIIMAVVKVNPAGTGTFMAFAKGTESFDKSYSAAVIAALKRIAFDSNATETLVTLKIQF